MPIKYELAEDIQQEVNELAKVLFPHVKLDSVVCIRSFGSSSRGTIARCHALGKAMQIAMGRRGFYVIEVISKRFDRLPEKEKTKTLIHELMHIPKSFGGGFIHHNIVHEKNVQRMYDHYISLKEKGYSLYSDDKEKTIMNRNKSLNDLEKSESDNENPNIGQKIEKDFFIIKNKKKRFWFN